jgi:hypothetical protein
VAVDVREPQLTNAQQLRAAYLAKSTAEIADADALVGAPPGSWDGPLIDARIAFVAGEPQARGAVLGERVADAVMKAAEALGAGDAVFAVSSRPVHGIDADAAAKRLRLALETVDPLAVIALDPRAAADLAAAFGTRDLREGSPVRAFGRALGSAGDFASSLDDPAAKARAWSAMKGIASLGGLDAKVRSKPAPEAEASK